jgi:hypothetical protein
MSRFAVVYEDPDYEDYVTDEEIYVEAGVVPDFKEWTPEAQQRLIQDVVGKQHQEEEVYSPYLGS